MLPLNLETYYFDIRQAAKDGSHDWKLLHDLRGHYKALANDLRPSNFLRLAESFNSDEGEAIKYWKNYQSGGAPPEQFA